jgi:hypothetical protein
MRLARFGDAESGYYLSRRVLIYRGPISLLFARRRVGGMAQM